MRRQAYILTGLTEPDAIKIGDRPFYVEGGFMRYLGPFVLRLPNRVLLIPERTAWAMERKAMVNDVMLVMPTWEEYVNMHGIEPTTRALTGCLKGFQLIKSA